MQLPFEKASCTLPTRHGQFTLHAYRFEPDGVEHAALVSGVIAKDHPPLVRVHSQCLTGDLLGSNRCDCGDQFDKSLNLIARAETGILVYLAQEGRGIGLLNKVRAYRLQEEEGLDTVDANLALGFPADQRSYVHAAVILCDLGVRSVHLLTNNPEKISGLEAGGIGVVRRVALLSPARPDNRAYLGTKVHRMRHLSDIIGLVAVSEPAQSGRTE